MVVPVFKWLSSFHSTDTKWPFKYRTRPEFRRSVNIQSSQGGEVAELVAPAYGSKVQGLNFHTY
jgi:hypothetical protein